MTPTPDQLKEALGIVQSFYIENRWSEEAGNQDIVEGEVNVIVDAIAQALAAEYNKGFDEGRMAAHVNMSDSLWETRRQERQRTWEKALASMPEQQRRGECHPTVNEAISCERWNHARSALFAAAKEDNINL